MSGNSSLNSPRDSSQLCWDLEFSLSHHTRHGKAIGFAFQVSRAGRVRAPPLAFWANERISRNADPSGGSAIERGFSDRLAQQCESFVQSPSGKKPKKASLAFYRSCRCCWYQVQGICGPLA